MAPATGATVPELFERANTFKQQGNFPAAESVLKELLVLDPVNADGLFQLGLVEGFNDNFESALQHLERARSLAPLNLDIPIAIARVKSWQGHLDEAMAEIGDVLARSPTNEEALAFKQDLNRRKSQGKSRDDQLWRLDANYSKSAFGRSGNKPWREGGGTLQYRLTTETNVRGGILESYRYGLDDTQMRIGIDHSVTSDVNVRLDLAATPSADFLPRWDAAFGMSGRVHDDIGLVGATWLTGEIRQRDYATGTVRSLSPGLEQYFFDDRATLTFRSLNSQDVKNDKILHGWLARLDVRPFDQGRIFAGRAQAPETDLGVSYDVYSTFGGVSVDVADGVSIGLNYTYEERKNSFTRNEVTTAITVRF